MVINESFLQENKLKINLFASALEKYAKQNLTATFSTQGKKLNKVRVTIHTTQELYYTIFYGEYALIIDKVFTEQVGNLLFLLAKVHLVPIEKYIQTCYGDGTVLSTLTNIVASPSTYSNVYHEMVHDDLKNINIKDKKSILSSNVYNKLENFLKDLSAYTPQQQIKSNFVKSLKTRNNVVPICWVDTNADLLYFPYTMCGRDINNKTYRTATTFSGLLSDPTSVSAQGWSMLDVVEMCMTYTPFRNASVVDFPNLHGVDRKETLSSQEK